MLFCPPPEKKTGLCWERGRGDYVSELVADQNTCQIEAHTRLHAVVEEEKCGKMITLRDNLSIFSMTFNKLS